MKQVPIFSSQFSFWEFEVPNCFKYLNQGLKEFSSTLFKLWKDLEKYYTKWGCIPKTKTCNTHYGHLEGWKSNGQNYSSRSFNSLKEDSNQFWLRNLYTFGNHLSKPTFFLFNFFLFGSKIKKLWIHKMAKMH